MNRIKLTYDEKKKSVKVVKQEIDGITCTKTIVSIPCIFKETRLNKELAELGFKEFPEFIRDILEKYGFKYDYKLGGWTRRFKGETLHRSDGGDPYSEEYGYNVAMTKAKYKSQSTAWKIMTEIHGIFCAISTVFEISADHFNQVTIAESEALERVMETGYCAKNKN
jgi:hypothetical protein